MPVSVFHHRVIRASFGAALVLALCAGGFASKAFAADDEVEDTADTKFFKNMLKGLGLQDGTEKGIDYHERSPLVVPPSINLPPPEAGKTASGNPAWPKDPDVSKATTVKKKARARTPGEDENDSMRMLTAKEMAPGSARGERPDGPAAAQGPGGARPEQLTPTQLGHEGLSFNNLFGGREGKEVKFVKEPERTTLTEPPVGLRTPSSKYTYGTKGRLDPTKEVGSDQAVFGVDK